MRSLPVVWHEGYEVDIGPHVFPTHKYRAARDRLVQEGTIAERDIRRPEPASDRQVSLVHTPAYLNKIETGAFGLQDVMLLEVPFSTELRDAMWLVTGGSILTSRLAVETGRAVHLGGGFHHAFPDHGEGFCLVNDVAIAVRVLMVEGSIDRAAPPRFLETSRRYSRSRSIKNTIIRLGSRPAISIWDSLMVPVTRSIWLCSSGISPTCWSGIVLICCSILPAPIPTRTTNWGGFA
ncbi:MAG: hypothetical protein PVI01_05210 [Gemmatimonadales bacterium]